MDYGLLGGIGNFLKEGVDTYRGVKKQQSDEQARQNALLLQASQAGYQFDPTTNSLNPTEGLLAKNQLSQKQAEEGLAEYDPNSELSQNRIAGAQGIMKAIDPNMANVVPEGSSYQDLKSNMPLLSLIARGQEAKNKQENMMSFRDDQLDKRQAFQAHKQVVASLKNDPQLKQELTQLRNLDNASSIVARAKNLTPQQIEEFQQSVRSNLGIKGGSGVNERAGTYLKSLGWRADEMAQFLTGSPATISQNDPLVRHIKELAQIESENVKGQFQDRVDALTGGYGSSVYEKHPEFKKDLDALLKSVSKQGQTRVLGKGLLQPEANNSPASSQELAIPEVGEVRDGYKYIGGPLNNPNSWKKQ